MPNGAGTVLEHSRRYQYDGRRWYSTVREPIPGNGAATLAYIYVYTRIYRNNNDVLYI